LNPGLSEAYYGRASLFLRRGEYEKAAADLSRVIELGRANAAAYYYRALARAQNKQYALARDDLLKAEKLGFPDIDPALKKELEKSGAENTAV
jgi:tetratricopeptide (TPR) repeat protein